MLIRKYLYSIVFLCCAAASLLCIPPAISAAQKKSEPAPAKAAEPKPPAEDPLGRNTPSSTVLGFLRAADRGDYERAARYLEGKHTARKKEDLARELRIVLNRGLRIGLDDLSKAPEGRLDDGLDVYLEKVGTATYGADSLDIILRRTTKPDTPPIWLFSSETLLNVTDAAQELELGWGEAVWPEWFREINVFSVPLFMLINLMVGAPIMLLASWLLMRMLVAILRPLILRWNAEEGESAIGHVKSLVFLLIFAGLLRAISPRVVTVAGRLLAASLATVLIIVAITWLGVRITRFLSRSKIAHLQQSGVSGSIAAVELSTWFFVCLWIIAGVFLVLRSLGFEATAAVAGLGVGGIAVAFAAQKTIENLFGTVTIVTDKPIRVGDYCQAGTTEGGVESIGLRSTRIRTADRNIVTIPNGQLASMTIGNFTHRDKFMFRHNIRLRYDTTPHQLRQVLANIMNMMSTHPQLEASTLRTRLTRFGDYSLDIEVFAYVLTRDGIAFLEIQEDLLLRIMDIIEASGTSVALPYPVQPASAESEASAKTLASLPDAKQARSA